MASTLHLLGGAVLGDPASGRALPADRRGCLLAYLATDGGWVDRDRLALLFWPDSDETSAKRNLRQLLLRVKRMDLDPALEATADALRWRVPCDVAEFRQAVAVGDPARAVTLYRGPFMKGFSLHDVGGVDAWIETERDRFHGAFHGACMRDSATASAQGRHGDAADRLSRLLSLDPIAEDVLAAYLRALHLAGRRDAALQAFDRFSATLREELGLDPLDTTTELADAIRRGEALAAPPPSAPTGDEGRTQLRPPRLVGREAERLRLREATTPLLVVAGEPGIGKTRLLREALPDAPTCGASEGLEQMPYHPFAALVRTMPSLAAGLGPYLEDLARLVPEVAPELAPGPLDPATAKGRLAEALARFVLAAGQPLVVDDLQWADPATLETLVYFAGRGLRVVGAYRTAEAGPGLLDLLRTLSARGQLQRVELGALSEDGVRALIGDLMNRASGPPTFARWLWERSGGNPMFLLESLRSLFESGVLRTDGEAWRTDVDELTRDYGELDVPPAVAEVIDRRLAHLAGPTVRVLEALALTQMEPDARFLAGITGLSLSAVAEALDEALRAGFVEHGRFRHDLLRQCLDRRIEPARRRLLHAMVAEAMAGEADPGLVAEHWWRAGDTERASATWLLQARGMRARGLQVDAIAVLRSAADRLPQGGARDRLRLTLVETYREAAMLGEAEALLAEARPGPDAPAELRFKAMLAEAGMLFYRGSVAETAELLEANRTLASLVDDPDLQLDDVMLRAKVAKEQVRSDEAIALMEPVVQRLRQRRPDLRLVQFISGLGALYDDLERHDIALPLHTEALDLARSLGSRYYQVETTINLLFCYADLGRHLDAAGLAEEALNLGDYDGVPVLRNNLAANYFQGGQLDDALRHYLILAELRAQPHLRLIAVARCAEIHARHGRADEAMAGVEQTLEALPHTDFPVAIGRAAVVVLRYGDKAQLGRLLALLPSLDVQRLPAHQREEFDEAMRSRGVTPT